MGTKFNTMLLLLALGSATALAAEPVPGADVRELLALAHAQNPELAAMRHEADAATGRIDAATALPDPSFRMSLQDFTNKESGGAATLVPSQVGSTYYRVMQTLPFWASAA